MTNQIKILVRAYINENLGDDLFLKILFERYKDVDFFLIDAAEENCKSFQNFNNVYYIKLIDVIKKNNKFHGFIDIGGSIFIQDGNGLGGFKKRVLISLLLRIRKKKTFILGANFGPYNTNYYKHIYKYYFKLLVKDICFRDKKSYNLFKNLDNVRYAPDIVFQFGNTLNDVNKIKNSIGISVMDIRRLPNLKEYFDDYIDQMVDLITTATKKKFTVSLISFCGNQGDNEAIKIIYSKLDTDCQRNIKFLNYNENINKFLSDYSKLENMVTLRFHSLILSLVYNQNIYPLIYSKKTLNVIEDLNSSIGFTEIKNIKEKSMDELLEELKNNCIEVKKLVTESKKQFKYLDMYIKGHYEH